MNCPKCNLQALPDQKFCRGCGASLQMTTQRLTGRAAVSDLAEKPATRVKGEERANRLLPWAFIIMFIGVAIGIIGKMMLHQEMITVIGVLVSLLGMFLTVYPYLAPAPSPKARQKHESLPSSQPELPTQSQPTRYLPHESNGAYIPSVTERTTDLLEVSVPTRTKKEDGE